MPSGSGHSTPEVTPYWIAASTPRAGPDDRRDSTANCAIRFAGAVQECPSLPQPDCLETSAPAGSSLKLAAGIRDRITWKWSKGEETVASHIGSPDIGDDIVFCLYENDSAGPRLIGEWDAEAGRTCSAKPCWVAAESRATYVDRELREGSVRRIRIKGGEGRPSSLRADLAGLALAPPAPPMNDSAAITMQLLNLGTGACWTGEHTVTDRNDTARFASNSN